MPWQPSHRAFAGAPAPVQNFFLYMSESDILSPMRGVCCSELQRWDVMNPIAQRWSRLWEVRMNQQQWQMKKEQWAAHSLPAVSAGQGEDARSNTSTAQNSATPVTAAPPATDSEHQIGSAWSHPTE